MKCRRPLLMLMVTFLWLGNAADLAAVGPVSPTQWPSSRALEPQVEGWPNAIRVFGSDRYGTNLATSLMLRGEGDYPYSSPDPASGSDSNLLALGTDWWGLRTCPRSVILVASDSPSDALVATVLSDPTGLSREPLLKRSAAADLLFDPIGGYQRVDTDSAPVLITKSARSGARSLSLSAKIAIRDLSSGGCQSVRQAVIIGGYAAISPLIDEELVSIGVSEVFRVQGLDRYATAAAIAQSLGTSSVVDSERICDDVYGSDGNVQTGFYGNAVVEWRNSSSECELLPNAVVIADGVTGADAIAAGWWTSYWQVPILLHDGSEKLRIETAEAIQSLDVANIIVLGGVRRISDAVVREAVAITGAKNYRVAGPDRFATSVAMAERFGGWIATGDGFERQSSLICFASSSSSSSNKGSRGWPDALGAGAWCGKASAQVTQVQAPKRSLFPHNGQNPNFSRVASKRPQQMVPVLLIPAGSQTLPGSVKNFLERVYPSSSNWCSSGSPALGCLDPGFAAVFGGSSVISNSILGEISAYLNGNGSTPHFALLPTADNAFATRLEMTPVYFQTGSGDIRLCVSRGSYEGTRWLVAYRDSLLGPSGWADVIVDGWYLFDAGGEIVSPGTGAPGCLRVASEDATSLSLRAVSAQGWSSEVYEFETKSASYLAVAMPISVADPIHTSGDSLQNESHAGGVTSITYQTPGIGNKVTVGRLDAEIYSSSVEITIKRGTEGTASSAHVFDAAWTIVSSDGILSGKAIGGASFINGVWYLRGRSVIDGRSLPVTAGTGGFSMNISSSRYGNTLSTGTWQIDAELDSK